MPERFEDAALRADQEGAAMTEYTPTDEEVRLDYIAAYTDQQSSQLLAGMAFDRWLAAHDARVRAEASQEALDWLVREVRRLIPKAADPAQADRMRYAARLLAAQAGNYPNVEIRCER